MKFKIRRSTSSKHSVITGTLIGVLSSFVISILMIIGITTLVAGGKIANNVMEIALFMIRTCSVCAGILIAASWVNEKCFVVSAIVALGYLLLLVCLSVIIFDSFLNGILRGVISTVVGAGLGIVIRLKMQGSNKKLRKINKLIVHN